MEDSEENIHGNIGAERVKVVWSILFYFIVAFQLLAVTKHDIYQSLM